MIGMGPRMLGLQSSAFAAASASSGVMVVLLFLRQGTHIRSNFWIVDICDRHIGVIPSFLHPCSRELESGNPP